MSQTPVRTVLITGASGFIGTHLLDRLGGERNLRLVVLTRGTARRARSGAITVATSLDQLSPAVWHRHGVDRIDVVFHLGGYIPKSASVPEDVDALFRDNLEGTRRLLDSLQDFPARVVFASTIDVYGPNADGIIADDSPISPTSLYGASKLFCEEQIRAHSRRRGTSHAILRYGHIYGPGEAAYAKLLPQTIKCLLRNETPVIFGDGSAKRDFMFVGDAVEASMRATGDCGSSIDALNIVSGQSRPVREYVELLARLCEARTAIDFQPGGAGRSFELSNRRMLDTLGAWDLCPLERGLQEEINYFKRLQ